MPPPRGEYRTPARRRTRTMRAHGAVFLAGGKSMDKLPAQREKDRIHGLGRWELLEPDRRPSLPARVLGDPRVQPGRIALRYRVVADDLSPVPVGPDRQEGVPGKTGRIESLQSIPRYPREHPFHRGRPPFFHGLRSKHAVWRAYHEHIVVPERLGHFRVGRQRLAGMALSDMLSEVRERGSMNPPNFEERTSAATARDAEERALTA